MARDTDKIDKAVLALLQLGLHDETRTWKTIDWEAMNRLYEKGFISNPVGKAKSVQLTDLGMVESRRLFTEFFEASGKATMPKSAKSGMLAIKI